MRQICATCKHYIPKLFPADDGDEYQGYGNCKRFPPKRKGEFHYNSSIEGFPQVDADETCGEWYKTEGEGWDFEPVCLEVTRTNLKTTLENLEKFYSSRLGGKVYAEQKAVEILLCFEKMDGMGNYRGAED